MRRLEGVPDLFDERLTAVALGELSEPAIFFPRPPGGAELTLATASLGVRTVLALFRPGGSTGKHGLTGSLCSPQRHGLDCDSVGASGRTSGAAACHKARGAERALRADQAMLSSLPHTRSSARTVRVPSSNAAKTSSAAPGAWQRRWPAHSVTPPPGPLPNIMNPAALHESAHKGRVAGRRVLTSQAAHSSALSHPKKREDCLNSRFAQRIGVSSAAPGGSGQKAAGQNLRPATRPAPKRLRTPLQAAQTRGLPG